MNGGLVLYCSSKGFSSIVRYTLYKYMDPVTPCKPSCIKVEARKREKTRRPRFSLLSFLLYLGSSHCIALRASFSLSLSPAFMPECGTQNTETLGMGLHFTLQYTMQCVCMSVCTSMSIAPYRVYMGYHVQCNAVRKRRRAAAGNEPNSLYWTHSSLGENRKHSQK